MSVCDRDKIEDISHVEACYYSHFAMKNQSPAAVPLASPISSTAPAAITSKGPSKQRLEHDVRVTPLIAGQWHYSVIAVPSGHTEASQ